MTTPTDGGLDALAEAFADPDPEFAPVLLWWLDGDDLDDAVELEPASR